jgi:hypothetical protein
MSYFSTFLRKARVPINGTSSKIWTSPPVRSPKRNTIEIYRFTTPPQSPNINLRVQMGTKRKNRKRWSKRFSLNRPSTERQILTLSKNWWITIPKISKISTTTQSYALNWNYFTLP